MKQPPPAEPSDEQADNPYRSPRTPGTMAAEPPSVGPRDANARKMFAPLFCPECGSYYADSTCKLSPVRWSFDRFCPRCDRRLWVAGWVFPIIGVVLGFPCMLILDPQVETFGTVLLIGFLALGVVQLARERLIRRRTKKFED